MHPSNLFPSPLAELGLELAESPKPWKLNIAETTGTVPSLTVCMEIRKPVQEVHHPQEQKKLQIKVIKVSLLVMKKRVTLRKQRVDTVVQLWLKIMHPTNLFPSSFDRIRVKSGNFGNQKFRQKTGNFGMYENLRFDAGRSF